MIRHFAAVFVYLFLSSAVVFGIPQTVSAQKLTEADLTHASKLAQTDLTKLCVGDGKTGIPSVIGNVENSTVLKNEVYVFTCRAPQETIEYHFNPEKGLLNGLTIFVNSKPLSVNPVKANPVILASQTPKKEKSKISEFEDELVMVDGQRQGVTDTKIASGKLFAKLLEAKLDGKVLVCRYDYRSTPQSEPIILEAKIQPIGKTLAVGLKSDSKQIIGFQMPTSGGAFVNMDFLVGGIPRYLAKDRVYVTAYPDIQLSDASAVTRESVMYEPLTDGSRRTLRDTFYITVSSIYEETLLNSPYSPSPYLDEFSKRVYLDIWEGSFKDSGDWVTLLTHYGINSCIVLKHQWQRKGFDRSWPKGYPASEGLGGDKGLLELSRLCRKLGHRFGIHENLYDLNPTISEDLWNPDDITLKSDGSLQDHIFGNFFLLKPSRHLDYAKIHTGEAFKRYELSVLFHDVVPRSHVDFDASVAGAGIARVSQQDDQIKYFNWVRNDLKIPALSEMTSGLLAGAWDGGCNAYKDNEKDRKPLVTFELLKVHPKMINQGIGYYERWLPQGGMPGWDYYNMTDRQMDKYRAMAIAFGRMGIIGRQIHNMRNVHAAVREYHLMQAFGRAYINQKPVTIAYYVEENGKPYWIDAATASRLGKWQRLRVVYEGGQEVYVNYSDKPWMIAGKTLPGYGSMTTGPRGTSMTTTIDGQIVDYAKYENVTYADARSHYFRSAQGGDNITPTLGECKDNHDGTIDISVVWNLERKLEHDYNIFMEFKEFGTSSSRPVFHPSVAPPSGKPTSIWEVGKPIVDTRRVKIPDNIKCDNLELVIGMTHPKGYAPRPRLVDIYNKIRIAQLVLERKDGKITSIKIKPAQLTAVYDTRDEVYAKDANLSKSVINFGEIATDGAVVVTKTDKGKHLVPVPVGEQINVGLTENIQSARGLDINGNNVTQLEVQKKDGKSWLLIPDNVAKVEIE